MRFLFSLYLLVGCLTVVRADEPEMQSFESAIMGIDPDWRVDSVLQFHSLSDEGKPLIGAALARHLTLSTSLGMRALVSFPTAGSYSLQAFGRVGVAGMRTLLFLEPSFSYNLVNRGSLSVFSAGAAVGVTHPLTADMSVGGTAGFEVFAAEIPSAVYARLFGLGVAPKILLEITLYL